jgi:hypothetical protein
MTTAKETEADGGPVIFVNQSEVTDGWTAEEVQDFRGFLARMAPIWGALVVPPNRSPGVITTTFDLRSPPLLDARTGERFWPLSALDPEEPPSDTCRACGGRGWRTVFRTIANPAGRRKCPACDGADVVSRGQER